MIDITQDFHKRLIQNDTEPGHLVCAQQSPSITLAMILKDEPLVGEDGLYWFELRRYTVDGYCYQKEHFKKSDISDLQFLPRVGNMFTFFEIAEV